MTRLFRQRAGRASGVNRSTVYRTRVFMENELHLPFLSKRGRYRLDRQKQLGSIRLSPLEALALYLDGRRLQQQTRIAHLPTAAALEKLAIVLPPADDEQPGARRPGGAGTGKPTTAGHNLEQIVEGWDFRPQSARALSNPARRTARVHMISLSNRAVSLGRQRPLLSATATTTTPSSPSNSIASRRRRHHRTVHHPRHVR